MKRHRSLHSLSREHHTALVQARNLRNAGTDLISFSLQDLAQQFISFWDKELIAHFRKEEELLLPALARFSQNNTAEITQLLFEHLDLRCRLEQLRLSLQQTQTLSITTLNQLGEILYNHIRFEENMFFSLVEQNVPELELIRLLKKLENNN